MIELEATDDGVLLPVRAQPKARKNGITGVHDGRLKVAVTEPPEKGKANAAIVQVLAKSLGLKKSQVELVSGASSTQKRFRLSGVDVADLRKRLKDCFSESDGA